MNIGVTSESLTMFETTMGPLRFYDLDDNVQQAVSYEYKRDLKIIRRKVYGFLDFLGDIGGLAGALTSFFYACTKLF